MIKKALSGDLFMNSCSNLFYLSSVACKLSECLSEKELASLSADLVVLSDMLANIIAHQALCNNDAILPECEDPSDDKNGED